MFISFRSCAMIHFESVNLVWSNFQFKAKSSSKWVCSPESCSNRSLSLSFPNCKCLLVCRTLNVRVFIEFVLILKNSKKLAQQTKKQNLFYSFQYIIMATSSDQRFSSQYNFKSPGKWERSVCLFVFKVNPLDV